MSFKEWMRRVDSYMSNWTGLDHLSIGDHEWYSWFEDEMSPKEAAIMALEDEGLEL